MCGHKSDACQGWQRIVGLDPRTLQAGFFESPSGLLAGKHLQHLGHTSRRSVVIREDDLSSCVFKLVSRGMGLRCLFGVHRPSPVSMARRGHAFVALCDQCARPLERSSEGRWVASEPLDLAPAALSRDLT
jgi:hypothetical protein